MIYEKYIRVLYYEAVSVGYDYELLFALGSFLGIKTSEEQSMKEFDKEKLVEALFAGEKRGVCLIP